MRLTIFWYILFCENVGKGEKQQGAMAKFGKYRMDGFGLIGFYRLNYSIAVSGTNSILPISSFHLFPGNL